MRKLLLFCGIPGLAIAIAGCSSNSSTPAVQTSGVLVHISDPSTCSGAHGGSFDKVLVTISNVQAHTNPSAGPNDGGWVDLTSQDLKDHPVQVNLLSEEATNCFLATLGARTQIQPGTYQQIRLRLADNSQASSIVGGNQCQGAAATAVNCVQFSNKNWAALTIPSGLQTGIKIPSGQIAGGQFTVPAGQTVDLDVDFNTCASLILAGNQVLLKPVLHAGEVSLQTKTINGTVVDSSGHAISGAIVRLTQPNPSLACSGAGCVSSTGSVPVEDTIMETTTDASGNFVFCPILGTGPFHIVAFAASGNTEFAATVVSGFQVGNTLTGTNAVKLVSAGNQATINGTVTTTSTSNTAIAEQGITVVPLQPVTVGGTNVLLPIPMFGGITTVTTVNTVVPNPNTCTPNTVGCGNYTLLVPADNPNVGVFNATSGTTYTQSSSAVNYIVDAKTSSCNPSEEQTDQRASPPGGSLTVTAGGTFTASTLAFTACQ